MDKFVWTEEYGVGIKEIDEQHKHFFGIANEVVDLSEKENFSKEEVFAALEGLGDYAFYHFKTEEDYFDKFNYPEAPLHIDAHNKFRETVSGYLADIRKKDVDVKKMAEDAASYSADWLFKHILAMDRKYSKFFNERGLN